MFQEFGKIWSFWYLCVLKQTGDYKVVEYSTVSCQPEIVKPLKELYKGAQAKAKNINNSTNTVLPFLIITFSLTWPSRLGQS